MAFGKRDIAGTGLFDGEYLVASKQAGPFDFTLGMAWGYAGNAGNITNPFCRVSDKYCHRAESHDAGDISFSDIFVVRRPSLAALSIKRRGILCV